MNVSVLSQLSVYVAERRGIFPIAVLAEIPPVKPELHTSSLSSAAFCKILQHPEKHFVPRLFSYRLNNEKFENTLALVAVSDPADPTVSKYREAVVFGNLRSVQKNRCRQKKNSQTGSELVAKSRRQKIRQFGVYWYFRWILYNITHVLCTQEKHGEVRGTVPVLRGYGRASSSPTLAGKNVEKIC
jgi:hypothetical protein